MAVSILSEGAATVWCLQFLLLLCTII